MSMETPAKPFVGALVALIKTIQDKDSGKKKRKKAELDVETAIAALFDLSNKTATANVQAAAPPSVRTAKKPAARKHIVKKPAARKTIAKKPAARKPAAKKT